MGLIKNLKTDNDKLISRLFMTMLPVQILIFAMGFINTIVDGVIAGRFIGASEVGVVGLYFPMVYIMNAAGSVLLGGSSVLCGRYLGRGELNKTNGIFSLDLTVTLIIGVVLAGVSLVASGFVAVLLGASEELKGGLSDYVAGYAVGIIPMLLAQQIASFLQMERQEKRGYAGIAGLIISNIALDVLFVAVMDMGVWGLALATSLSNCIYFLILASYYFSSKAKFRFSIKNVMWSELPAMIRIGSPGALLVFCIAVRGMVINRILLHYAGSDGLSAMAAFNMIYGLFISICVGSGSVVRMLTSVFEGEEDRDSMKKVLKTAFAKGLPIACAVGLLVLVLAPVITGLFFPDSTSEVYRMTRQLFMIYSVCVPMVLVCQVMTNYFQSTGHVAFVNVQSLFDGFFSMVIPACILAPLLGALGVWLANPIGIILTLLTVPAYCLIRLRHLPSTSDEWMLLDPDFGASAEDCLDIPIHDMTEVSSTSERVLEFCEAHDMDKKTAYFSALCLEEIAGNVVSHGFSGDSKKHSLNARVVFREDRVILRLKDDCAPFDPDEYVRMISDESSVGNIGIRMVYSIADDVNYQNLLGMNVLTIILKEDNLIEVENNDFLLEKRLRELDPALHRRFRDTALVCVSMLQNYRLLFPEYTDHSELHSLTVIDSCNRLIGTENIGKLNANEIYVLLMACYLHDAGMGISEKDYEEFKDVLGEKQYFEKHPSDSKADFVRTYHNEFSGLFIEKYAELFDMPSEEYVHAVRQVTRGHRKTDLFDEKEYPADYRMPDGSTICLPYLSALIRLADEVDVVASRNPLVLFDIDLLTDEVEIHENRKLMAVKSMKMTRSSFILYADTDDEEIMESIERMVGKMQLTLDTCREVVEKRTPFTITQKKIVLERAGRN